MGKRLLSVLLAAVWLFAAVAYAQTPDDILLLVEEPLDNDTYTGVSNIRGWALARAGIDRIELLIDGVLRTSIPAGGRRPDVGMAFPDFPNAIDSGFSMAFNYSNLSRGQHTMTVRAVDNNDRVRAQTVTFNVVRLDTPFVSDAASVSLQGATITHDDSTIRIEDMQVGGQRYAVELTWRTAAQDLDITRITPTGGTPVDMAGVWAVQETLVSENCTFAEPVDLRSSGVDGLDLEQNGAQLSGTTSAGTLEVAGSIGSSGDFILTSPAQNRDLGNGCSQAVAIRHTGNVLAGTMESLFTVTFSGSCPSAFTTCQVVYRGTLVRSAATRSLQAAEHLYQLLLDALSRSAQ